MDEVGAKFNTLTKNEQAYVTTAMFGTFQRNKGLTLLQNYNQSLENYETALNSAGTAQQKFDIYQESSAAKMDKFKASIEGFWQKLISSDTIKTVIDSLNKLVQILDVLINNSFTSTLIQAGLLTTAIVLLGNGFKSLRANALKGISGIVGFEVAEKSLLATTRALTATMLASPLFWVAVGSLAIFGIIKAVDALTTSLEEQKEKVENLSKEYEDLKSKISGLEGDLKTTSDRIDELNKKDKLSIIEQDELEKLKLTNKELQARIDLLNKQSDLTSKKLGREALNLYDRQQVTGEVSKQKVNEIKYSRTNTSTLIGSSDLNQLMAAYERIIQLKKEANDPEETEHYSILIDEIEEKINNQSMAFMDVRDKLRALPNPTKEQKDAIDEINKSLVTMQSLLDPKQAFEDVWKSLDQEQQKYLQTLAKTNQLIPNQLQQYGELFNLVKYGGFSYNDLKQAIESTNVAQEKSAESTGLVIEKTKELDDIYKDTTSNLEDLNQVIYDISQGESLSAKQVEELILKYPQLEQYVKKTADGYTIEKQALEILNDVRKQSATTAWLAQAGITQASYDNLKSRLDAYKIEIEAIGGIGDAYKAMMPYMASGASSQLVADTFKYAQAVEKLNTLKTTLQDPTYGIKETKSSGTKSGSTKTETELKTVEIDQFYKLQEAIDRTNNSIENNKKLLSNTDDVEEQIKIIEKLIALYKEQQKQLHNIAEAKRDSIEDNVSKLEGYGFDVSYDRNSNDLRIANEEKINEIYGKNNKETNELRDKIQDIIKQTKEWNKDNIEAGSEWQNLAGNIKGAYSDIADIYKKQAEENAKLVEDQKKLWEDSNKTVIDLLKKRYEKEKDIKEKAHKDTIDKLDKELDAYKKYVENRLEEMDRLYDTEDYEKDVSDKSKEILDVQKEIDKYTTAANQGDLESIQKVKELNEQKLKLNDELQETQTKRERDLRKQNIQDNLSDFEEYINTKKEAENKSFEEYQTQLEQSMSETALALEAQKLLMIGTVTEVQNTLVQLFTDVGENATITGQLIQDELIDKLAQLQNIGVGLNFQTSTGSNIMSMLKSSASVLDAMKSFIPSSVSNTVNNFINRTEVPVAQGGFSMGDIIFQVNGSIDKNSANKVSKDTVSGIKNIMIQTGIIKR